MTAVTLLGAGSVQGQDVESGGGAELPAATATPAPAETTIEISSIPDRAEAADRWVRETETNLTADGTLEKVEAALAEIDVDLQSRTQKLDAAIERGKGPGELAQLRSNWSNLATSLSKQESTLDERGNQVQAWLGEAGGQAALWDRTAKEARSQSAPAPLLRQVERSRSALADLLGKLKDEQEKILGVRASVSERMRKIQAALDRIEAANAEYRASLFVRDQERLWGLDFSRNAIAEQSRALAQHLSEVAAECRRYAGLYHDRLLIHALLVVLLGLGIRSARGRLEQKNTPGARKPGIVLDSDPLARPWAAALLLGLAVVPFVESDAPRLASNFLVILGLPAWLLVLHKLLPKSLHAPAHALAGLATALVACLFFDRFELIARPLLTTTLVASVFCAAWVRTVLAVHVETGPWLRLLDGWLRLSLVLGGIGIGASILGYLSLASLTALVIVGGPYVGTLFLAAARVAEAIIEVVVEIGALDRLHAIEAHHPEVLRLVRIALRTVALAAWGYMMLNGTGLWQPAKDAFSTAMETPVGYPPVSFTLGGVIAFLLTLWITWQLARLIRLVLDEEVFPRVTMPPGVPFALSTFTRYTVLVIGFLAGLGMLGFSLDRATIVISAFGVGIGFGLQNVVNNFVSGVILLFERPIRVGDRVELDSLIGIVSSIGIRASTIRTFDGADVIVPNGDFISARVTNWTLADRKRRIILPVGVAYGTDPEKVIELLIGVARSNSEVLSEPEPQVLFRGFGDSSLDFEIRAWTESDRGWMAVQSELAVATNAALAQASIEIPFPQRDLHVRSVDAKVQQVLGVEPKPETRRPPLRSVPEKREGD